MKTRGLAIGAFALAMVFVVVGAVLQNQANFSKNYVERQLVDHGISFTPVENLMPSQQNVPCLVKNAGKPLTTGKQAECYALYQIGIDLTVVDQGKTYFQDHYNGFLMRQKMYAALKSDPTAQLPATQEAIRVSQKADTTANDLLAGEATEGLLLTAYGFSVIGARMAQAAVACFIVAALLVLAGIALFVMSTRKRSPSEQPQQLA